MGTYAQGQDYVYVSARVVRAGDAMVLGSADFRLPLNNNTRSLLEGQGGGEHSPFLASSRLSCRGGRFNQCISLGNGKRMAGIGGHLNDGLQLRPSRDSDNLFLKRFIEISGKTCNWRWLIRT